MRGFEESTLWRISEFERVRRETGSSGFLSFGASMLSSTLLADLRRIEDWRSGEYDIVEVLAASLRHREAVLLLLRYEELVWPVTVFPLHMQCHSPRDLAAAPPQGLATLAVLAVEPPGVRVPGHWMHERVGAAAHYRPLLPLLWRLALHGPRWQLLADIGGTAAYRIVPSPHGALPAGGGALVPAMERLRRESASLREIAHWPGMGLERASRLLNALYLASALLMTRSHPAARREPRPLFGSRRGR
ncbi:MAG TPA: hypothetical protein VF291_02115 [Burkholderiaceae bacterium]